MYISAASPLLVSADHLAQSEPADPSQDQQGSSAMATENGVPEEGKYVINKIVGRAEAGTGTTTREDQQSFPATEAEVGAPVRDSHTGEWMVRRSTDGGLTQ
jgi:hypothetical protein